MYNNSNHTMTTSRPRVTRPCHTQQPDGPDKRPADDVTTADRPPGIFKRLFSYRYVMVLLLHGSLFVTSVQRDLMPMVVVCMFDDEDDNVTSSSSSSSSLSSSFSSDNSTTSIEGLMATHSPPSVDRPDWDVQTRGLIITAGTLPCCLSPILGEFLRKRAGNKMALTIILGTGCVLTFLGPVIARTDPYLTIASRVLQGLCYGGNIPVIGDSLAWWAPRSEKLIMNTIIFTGLNTAGMILFFTSGYLCSIPVDGGWPFIYYTNGAISVIFLILWLTLSSRKPEEHPFISEKEKEYIVKHRLGLRGANVDGGKTPYLTILKSPPVLALLYSLSGHMWAMTLFLSFSPIYYNEVLHFSVQQTGLIMSSIGVCRMFGAVAWLLVGNWLMTKTSVTNARKIAIAIGFLPSGLAVASVAFIQEYSRWGVVGVMMVVFPLQMCGSTIFTLIPVDLAPRYAGFISAAWFFTSSLVAVSAPLSASLITSDGSLASWRIVWCIAGSISISMAIVFTIFGQAKLQPWATDDIDINVSSDIRPGVKSVKNGDANHMTGIDNPRFELESSYDMPTVEAHPASSSIQPENTGNGGSVSRTRL